MSMFVQKCTKSAACDGSEEAVADATATKTMAEPHGSQPPPHHRTPGRRDGPSEWYRLVGVGFEFIVAILVFGALGWWLDRKLGTLPWLMLAGAVLGFAAGLWLLLKAAFRSFRD